MTATQTRPEVDAQRVDSGDWERAGTMTDKTYMLLGADRKPQESTTPGTLGGHRGGRIYGRLDCPAALRAIAKGDYAKHRVLFADEATALAAGFRPCAACLPQKYVAWKLGREETP
ncbi:MAG: Ada metal-binding domain-containing protein [Cumulibacter sp.]